MQTEPSPPERRIFSVTELTEAIKSILESRYPFVWVAGEISNFRIPASGHFYFTLKDPGAQINAVMFRGQNRALKFSPEDGMSVIAMGRLSVYEARGIYQIILEYLEPEGVGALQLAFEQLKARLEAEGLFSQKHKAPLPFLPRLIGVVTSPTGAVIQDIIKVVYRRYPNMAVQIAPVSVQGEGAPEEIAAAIDQLNQTEEADVIILARGGGSLEDLCAFNSEVVARAIFASRIPIVSAVGHETDVTIADFVADVRAATPSAAAELVVPMKDELTGRIAGVRATLGSAISGRLRLLRERNRHISGRLVRPRRQVGDCRLRLDDVSGRVVRGTLRHIAKRVDQLGGVRKRLLTGSPQSVVARLKVLLEYNHKTIISKMQFMLGTKKATLLAPVGRLSALNPMAILERGYSITRILPNYALVKDARQIGVGEKVEVTLWRGTLQCQVERKKDYGQTDI
jgi:exodeoxyribonuclease VII large subunit